MSGHGSGGGRFNFPRWNYGYTLGPATPASGGNYTQFYVPQQPQLGGILPGPRVPIVMPPASSGVQPRPPMRAGGNPSKKGGATVDKQAETSASSTADQPAAAPGAAVKTEESKTETPGKSDGLGS